MLSALIGHTGFVGSNIMLDHKFSHLYNTKNINTIHHRHYNLIVCSGTSAAKWYANLYPDDDLSNINSLIDNLETVTADKFILISTIDVYNDTQCEQNEDFMPAHSSTAYGTNRLYLENKIMKMFKNYQIIRLPGLFGPGLKKNIIFDAINNNLSEINTLSIFQWYDITDLYKDIIKYENNKAN